MCCNCHGARAWAVHPWWGFSAVQCLNNRPYLSAPSLRCGLLINVSTMFLQPGQPPPVQQSLEQTRQTLALEDSPTTLQRPSSKRGRWSLLARSSSESAPAFAADPRGARGGLCSWSNRGRVVIGSPAFALRCQVVTSEEVPTALALRIEAPRCRRILVASARGSEPRN